MPDLAPHSIKAIETSYGGYRFRSRLEARWAVFFDALGITWEYEPEGYVLSDGTCYLPDFWLPGLLWRANGGWGDFDKRGMFAEVKPRLGLSDRLTQADVECWSDGDSWIKNHSSQWQKPMEFVKRANGRPKILMCHGVPEPFGFVMLESGSDDDFYVEHIDWEGRIGNWHKKVLPAVAAAKSARFGT